MWLFCYGSNNPAQLAERLERDDLETVRAFATGYARVFRGMSRRWGGGTCSLVKRPGKTTYGFCVAVTAADLKKLDRFEGVPAGIYERTKVAVTLDGGEKVNAVAYVSLSEEYNPPSKAYLSAVAKTISTFWKSSKGEDVTEDDIPIHDDTKTTASAAVVHALRAAAKALEAAALRAAARVPSKKPSGYRRSLDRTRTRGGQYDYDNLDLMCECGHSLGEHNALRACLSDDGCGCKKFKLRRRKLESSVKPTPAQITRQKTRSAGKYASLNPCEACGKSAGADYYSDDRSASYGKGLVLCARCAAKLAELSDAEYAGFPWK